MVLEFTGHVGYPVVEHVMCDMLNIPVMDIYGVELVTAHCVVQKFVGVAEYRDFLRRYEGRTLQLQDGTGSVSITDHSGVMAYVSVHGVS